MQLSIIGTGNMARGIGTLALAGGSSVTLYSRDAGKAQELARELGQGATVADAGAPFAGELVVLAVPYAAVTDVLAAYGPQLDGKVLVDITNPVDFATFEPIVPAAGSAAQQIAAAAPAARVVKAFNTTFAGTLVAGEVDGEPLDVFLAGDDEPAKELVAQLARDAGLRVIDAGPLRRAAALEALGYLHITIQQPLETGFASAVKVLA
jgi:8-hydroxy-5-deazaflavin:NADPH oxidoreductase